MSMVELPIGKFEFKLGLTSLIHLANFSNISVEDNFYDILYYGLKTYNPNISYEAVQSCSFSPDQKRSLFLELGLESIEAVIPTPATISEWIRQGIGEMGLSIETFNKLSPQELETAYQGYLRRMELSSALTQLSVARALNGNKNHIVLVPKETITQGSLTERQKTFDILGV